MRRVVVNDDLPALAAARCAARTRSAARIRAVLRDGGPLGPALAAEHVGYVVDERDQPDPDGDRGALADLPIVWQRGSLALLRGARRTARHRGTPACGRYRVWPFHPARGVRRGRTVGAGPALLAFGDFSGTRRRRRAVMADEPDYGLVLVALIVSAVVGALLAGALSFSLVSLGTAKPSAPVNKPLIIYDGS